MRWLPLLALGLSLGCRGSDRDLPAAYRGLAVPVERLTDPATRATGRTLFLTHCALCHGVRADGHGGRRSAFARPPADFTRPSWRQAATPRRVYFVVREGLRGTPMPAWKGTLSEDETWAVTAYLLSVAERGP